MPNSPLNLLKASNNDIPKEKPLKIRAKTSEKANQTEISFDLPGKSIKSPDNDNNQFFSRLNPENNNPLAINYKETRFSYEKSSTNADKVLKEYMHGFNNQKKSHNEKLNDSLYLENLCNIQEKTPFYEIKPLDKRETYIEDYRKVINLYNNPEKPYTFPDKLPGNMIKEPEISLKKLDSLIKIQKITRGFLTRKSLSKINNEKPVFLGQKILEKALENYPENEEFMDSETFQRTFTKKPVFPNDFIQTIKPVYKDPFEKSDGFSVISLFLKEKPQKIPFFTSPAHYLKPSLPINKAFSQKTEAFQRQSSFEDKNKDFPYKNKTESFQQQSSIEEYTETFEDLTPSQSFIKKSQTNLRESIIKESIEEENQGSNRKSHSIRESLNKESLEEGENEGDIMEESTIKYNNNNLTNKFHDNNSYNYEDEKFESLSEDKSMKIQTKKEESSGEEANFRKSAGNLKRNSDFLSTPKTKTPNILVDSTNKAKKSVNFSSEHEKIEKKDHLNIKEPQIIRDFSEKHEKIANYPEYLNPDQDNSSSFESIGKTVTRAKSEIEAFSRHDGELTQLKSQLFGVFNDLKTFPSLFNKNSYNHLKIEKNNELSSGENLYLKFKSEFSRLLNLKTANEYLEVYSKIDEKNRFKSLVLQDLRKEPLQASSLDNFQLEINNLKNKQEVLFETILALFQKNAGNQDFQGDIKKIQEQQLEILRVIDSQNEKIDDLLKKPMIFQEEIAQKPEKTQSISPIQEQSNRKPDNFLRNSENLLKISQISPKKDSFFKKSTDSIQETPNNNKKPLITREEETFKLEKPLPKPLSIDNNEEIDEYIEDFELSTPHIPNVQFQKSFELQKSQLSSKSPIHETLPSKIDSAHSLEQIRSMSIISSDKEFDNENDISGISWHNIVTPGKIQPSFKEETSNRSSKEKIIENLTEFITEKLFEDLMEKERLFPVRDEAEMKTLIEKLAKKTININKKTESLPAITRIAFNLDNFEEKSPTKLKKRMKSSTDDLLRSSLEMSVRNEEFISETEKAIRSLESKLKRRNNQEKIEKNLQILYEDVYNKINLFTEQDLKEKGPIIVDAFNEQLKMNIIKELNENRKRTSYYGEIMKMISPETIASNFTKICLNTKNVLLKSVQNQLKENEEYLTLKENVREFEFNKLFQHFSKEKYPLEEEENLEMLEFEINKDWEGLKRDCVEDVVEECVKDVISEMNRLGTKRGNQRKMGKN